MCIYMHAYIYTHQKHSFDKDKKKVFSSSCVIYSSLLNLYLCQYTCL